MTPTRTAAFLASLMFVVVIAASRGQSLPPGAIIIPTHTGNGGQNDVLKSYGLVYDLLAHNVPVSWAFSLSKIQGGPDFTAAGSQVMDRAYTAAVIKSFDYTGGVFIVHLSDTAAAGPVIRTHASDVTVHQVLYTFPSVPIRHTLRHTPRVFVQDHYGPWLQLITQVFTRANIPPAAYRVDSTGIPAISTLSYQGAGCFTSIVIPHDDSLTSTDVSRLKEFADSGGTVYLQCASVLRFENQSWPVGHVLSTDGLQMRDDPNRAGQYWTHPDSGAHTTLGQFTGIVDDCSGTLPAWAPVPGGGYRPFTIPLARMSNDTMRMKAAFARKDGHPSKGLLVFVGGHRFVPTNGSAVLVNNCRILLNTIFTPVQRRSCTPLPVNLVSFTAARSGDDVFLRWRTDAEVNSLGFDVERRVGTDDEWISIGFVRSEGESGRGSAYSYIDRSAAQAGSLLSYRLRQIDVDGAYEYSAIQTVLMDDAVPASLAATVYPNPARGETHLRFWLQEESGVTCTITDMFGRDRIQALRGENVPAGWHEIPLPTDGLAVGSYCVRIGAAGASVTRLLRIVR